MIVAHTTSRAGVTGLADQIKNKRPSSNGAAGQRSTTQVRNLIYLLVYILVGCQIPNMDMNNEYRIKRTVIF